MSERRVFVRGWSSLSALGANSEEVAEAYGRPFPTHRIQEVRGRLYPVFPLAPSAANALTSIREHPRYTHLDPVAHLAIAAGREAVRKAGWQPEKSSYGVSFGSARGAAERYEQDVEAFQTTGRLSPHSSPATTAGNISFWVAQDLQSEGPECSFSITCTSALHALATGVAWIRSGLLDRFLAGGAEAPLTPFTLAQMGALRLYAQDGAWPCRPGALENPPRNTMALGEGAGAFALEAGEARPGQIEILGLGFGFEHLESETGMGPGGLAHAMRAAIESAGRPIDAAVLHTPGTIQGDAAEFQAVDAIFGVDRPALYTTKHRTGHTFGASGALGLELALLLLQGVRPALPEFPNRFGPGLTSSQAARTVLVNAAGFGGNAISLVCGLSD